MGRQLQHDTVATGGPCKRCGLSYSQKTAYVPCFEEGDTWESWKARQPEELQPLLKPLEPGPVPNVCTKCGVNFHDPAYATNGCFHMHYGEYTGFSTVVVDATSATDVFKPKDVVIYETPPTVEESAKGYVAGGRHEPGGLLDPDDRDD